MSITLSPKTFLQWPDYFVIVLVLLLCTLLGFHFRQKKKAGNDKSGLMEFVLASRNLSVFPVAVSITATSLSAFSLTGVTGELYLYGIQYCIEYIGIFLGSIFAMYFIVPIYRESEYVSVFEIIEKRLDRTMRRVFSLAYIVQKLLFLALVIHLPALSLMTLTKFDYRITTVVLGFVCTLYSTLGGLRAVVWTDVLQALLMFATLIMVAIQATIKLGGVSELWEEAWEHDFLTNISFMEDSTTRYSIWSALAFGFLWALDLFMVNQALVQRVLGAKSDSAAKRSVIFGGFLSLVFGAVISLTGAALYVYYRECDPMKFPDYTGVKRIDQLFVYAIGDLFMDYPILKGIAISGIISASLSTFSSFVNSFAAVSLEDFVKPAFPRLIGNESASLLICMGLSFAFGTIAIFASFLIPLMGNAVRALGIVNGIFGGPLVGAAFLVLFYKKTSRKSCLGSLLIGISFNAWIIVGSFMQAGNRQFAKLERSADDCDWDNAESDRFTAFRFHNSSSVPLTTPTTLNISNSTTSRSDSVFMPLYQISFMWYPALGFVVTYLFGVLLSQMVGRRTIPTTPSRVYLHVKTSEINENGTGAESIALTDA